MFTLITTVLAAWEAEGHPIGTDAHLRIRQMLSGMGENPEKTTVRNGLAGILTQNAEEQALFYQIFEELSAELPAKKEIRSENPADTNSIKPQSPPSKKNAWILPVIATIVLCIGAWSIIPQLGQQQEKAVLKAGQKKNIEILDTLEHLIHLPSFGEESYDYATEGQADNVRIRFNGNNLYYKGISDGEDRFYVFASENTAADTFLFTVKIAANHAVATNNKSKQAFPPQITLEQFQNGHTFTNIERGCILPTQLSYKTLDPHKLTWAQYITKNLFSGPRILLFLFLFAGIFMAFAIATYWRMDRKLRERIKDIVPLAPNTPFFTGKLALLEHIKIATGESFAASLSKLLERTEDPHSTLDIKKTISKTAQNAGFISLQHQPLHKKQAYLLLIDLSQSQNTYLAFWDAMYTEMEKQQVEIHRFFYHQNMQYLWNENNPNGLDLTTLALKYADNQLIVIGDASVLWDDNSKELAINVQKSLAYWQDRSMISPCVNDEKWLHENTQIGDYFTLYPPTMAAWKAVIEKNTEGNRLTSALSNKYLTVNELQAVLAEQEKNFLFPWIAACAIPPIVSWETILTFGKICKQGRQSVLNFSNLLDLLQIQWFQTNTISAEIRAELLQYLKKESPKLYIEARKEWRQLLNQNWEKMQVEGINTENENNFQSIALMMKINDLMIDEQEASLSYENKLLHYTDIQALANTQTHQTVALDLRELPPMPYRKKTPVNTWEQFNLWEKSGLAASTMLVAAGICLSPPMNYNLPASTWVTIPAAKYDIERLGDKQTIEFKDFKIGIYEVSQATWKAVMGNNNPPAWHDCDECPMDNLSYQRAEEFIQKLNNITGKKFRFPTQDEWEYVALIGQTALIHSEKPLTEAVNSGTPNKFGVYNMNANVSEWAYCKIDTMTFEYVYGNNFESFSPTDVLQNISVHRSVPKQSYGLRLVLEE